MAVKTRYGTVLSYVRALIISCSFVTVAAGTGRDEAECHPKCRIWIAIVPLIITNLVTLTCCWRRSRETIKVHPREKRAAGQASLVELGVPKLAGEMILIRNRPTSRSCQPKQTASGSTNYGSKTTAHTQVTHESLNTSDPAEGNEQRQNHQDSSFPAEGDGKRLIRSTQGNGSTNSDISNSGHKSAEPTRDTCKVGHSNKSFRDDTVNLSTTYKPSTSSATFDIPVETSPSQEHQPTDGEMSHMAGHGAGQSANPCVHRLLGYESSVCSTDFELTPRPMSKLNRQVIYQSSLDSSDGEYDWRTFSDRVVVTEAVSEVDENLNSASFPTLSHSGDENATYLKKERIQRQEIVQNTQKFERVVTGLYGHQLETQQLSEDYDGSVFSGLGTDSLQRLNASWKRVHILKSQTSIESTNSYNSLRSGFLGGEEDNGGGLTDEDENKQRLEHKKKKHLKNSDKRGTNGSAVISPPDENRLSVDEVRIMEKRNNYHTVTQDKISTESSSTINENTDQLSSGSSASEHLSAVVDMGYFTQDGAFNETFSVVSSVENQDEDSASDSSLSKVIQTEDVKIHSPESRRQDQSVADNSSQNATTGANKPTSNHDFTPFRRRLVNAVKERAGRKIYLSMEVNENQNGYCDYICV